MPLACTGTSTGQSYVWSPALSQDRSLRIEINQPSHTLSCFTTTTTPDREQLFPTPGLSHYVAEDDRRARCVRVEGRRDVSLDVFHNDGIQEERGGSPYDRLDTKDIEGDSYLTSRIFAIMVCFCA